MQTFGVRKPALSDKPLAGRFRLLRLHKDDSAGRAVLFARSTFYADIWVDPALGLALLNSIHRTSSNTRPTQNTFIPDYIWHCTVLGGVLSERR